jgi:HK97 family phage major capsid protein
MDDRLIYFGEALKMLERTDDTATVGGYLVRFTTDNDPDLTGEFFAKATRFDVEDGDTRPAYYHHGLDGTLKTRVLGRGTLRMDDVGVWAETQIRLADDYSRKVADMVEQGKLGYSSGAVSHLVEKEEAGKAVFIKTWPIGEISLTPTPAEPRNRVYTLKAAFDTPNPIPDPQPTSKMENTAPQINVQEAIDNAVKAAVAAMQPAPVHPSIGPISAPAPAIVKTVGDNPDAALRAWMFKGDMKAVESFINEGEDGMVGVNLTAMYKAPTDSVLNLTNADPMVPVGHYGRIIARSQEMALYNRLGVLGIPGKGTRVRVPSQSADVVGFTSTAESAPSTRDRPNTANINMDLVDYTKHVDVTIQTLRDEDAQLLPFMEQWASMALAATENDLLITAVETDGRNLGAFNASAIVAGQLEDGIYADGFTEYLEAGANFVMKAPTYAKVVQITGNERLYAPTNQGQGASLRPQVLGYPVYFSTFAEAIGAGNKSVLFGAWNNVGRRMGELTLIRDPYSRALNGEVRFLYRVSLSYKVIQSAGIGFLRHATA